MTATKTEDFRLHEGTSSGAEFVASVNRTGYQKGKFYLGLGGYGFDAHRYLSADELRDLREWINEALAEVGEL